MGRIKNNKCIRCNACKQVYYKGRVAFWVYRGPYYCTVLNKLTDVNGGCEQWRKKVYKYNLSKQRFDGVIKDVQWLIDNMSDEE